MSSSDATAAVPRRVHRGALFAGLAFALLCVQVLLRFAPEGLWEDGYFFLRYARNTWHSGVMAWNVADGPVHGMTSQLYQWLTTLVLPLAPRHFVTVSKLIGAASLLGALCCLLRTGARGNPEERTARHALPFIGLGMPLVLNHFKTGLETPVVLLWLAGWLNVHLRFREQRSGSATLTVWVVGTYLLRPDAVLIPLVPLLLGLRAPPARTVRVLAFSSLALGLCWLAFKLYYGTALPLSFYLKTYGLTSQTPEFLAIFWREKIKNASQLAYFFAPFVYVSLVARRPLALPLLAAAAAFCAYHAFFTVEVMGHHSRFYMPAVVPLVGAAIVSWDEFAERSRAVTRIMFVVLWAGSFWWLKRIDARSHVFIFIEPMLELPAVIGLSLLMLPLGRWRNLAAAAPMAVVLLAALYNYRLIAQLRLEDDQTILLRQIAPRAVFAGLARLTQLAPRHVYHTDMGAPGVLFPDSKVTDLDGILNEELTLKHQTFDALCTRDRPEAIFFPNQAYPRLRQQMEASACFRDYYRVADTRLFLRAELIAPFQATAR